MTEELEFKYPEKRPDMLGCRDEFAAPGDVTIVTIYFKGRTPGAAERVRQCIEACADMENPVEEVVELQVMAAMTNPLLTRAVRRRPFTVCGLAMPEVLRALREFKRREKP